MRRQEDLSASLLFSQSEFDPSGLQGTLLPFFDPFAYDDDAFQAAAPSHTSFLIGPPEISNLRSALSMLTSPLLTNPRFQGPGQEPLPLPQPVPPPVTVALDTHPERPVAPARTKLNPDQAIYIFNQRRNKTKRTAVRLSAEYGITPKAVRDIWTRRSWACATRPYWT